SFDFAITTSWFLVGEMVEALEDVIYHESYFVFDGGSIGLNGGIAVVEVEVEWSDDGRGGIYDGLVVKGGKRLSCIHCAFWIAASRGFLVDDEALAAILLKGLRRSLWLVFSGDSPPSMGGSWDHDVVNKIMNVRDSKGMGGVDMSIEANKEHSIWNHHHVASSYTLHFLAM
ncbi:hypothetical protein Tco_1007159, partial [Tanacetum coccineum]